MSAPLTSPGRINRPPPNLSITSVCVPCRITLSRVAPQISTAMDSQKRMVMVLKTLILLTLIGVVSAAPLLDFSAARQDDPKMIGTLNLEAARDQTVSANTNDLYVKLGTDAKGTSALHYHRIKGDIRAEYHALVGQTQADKTYYIGYKFSLAEVEKSLMIWQFKEYLANNDGGANIPLSLEVGDGSLLQFEYQASSSTGRAVQWSTKLNPNTVYSVGIVINTSTPGSVQLYWNGKLQTFSSNKKTTLPATTFPGRAEPKFGAYRGEAVQIDTYVYDIQIGSALSDIKRAAGL